MAGNFKALETEYYRVLFELLRKAGYTGRMTRANAAPLLEQWTRARMHPSRTWFISGISGSGKSTLVEVLEAGKYSRLQNVTTRARRPEEDKDAYVFMTDTEFKRAKKDGLLFHPHTTNGVWHSILRSDLKKVTDGKTLLYADKSVASLLKITKEVPAVRDAMFLYVLVPSFRELYARIEKREHRNGTKTGGLSTLEILSRFEEEIAQMRQGSMLPYAYVVNDERTRIQKLLQEYI